MHPKSNIFAMRGQNFDKCPNDKDMAQCESCSRWAHEECAPIESRCKFYMCDFCVYTCRTYPFALAAIAKPKLQLVRCTHLPGSSAVGRLCQNSIHRS